MILLLQILGIVLILLALLHVIFPRYFRWKEELAGLSLINREIMGVHTFFIALTVVLMGLLLVSSAELLTTTLLGRRICAGMALFWGLRLICQLLRTTLISGSVAKLTSGDFGLISTLSSSFVTSGVVFLVCGIFSKNGHFYDG